MQILAQVLPFGHARSLLLLPLLLVACGGSANLEGKIDGREFAVKDALFALGGESNLANESLGQQLTIVLTSFDDACKAYKDRLLPKNHSTMRFALNRTNIDPNTPAPSVDKGTYDIYTNLGVASLPAGVDKRIATVNFAPTDERCDSIYTANQINTVIAAAGSITVRTLKLGNQGTLEGDFDLSFGPQQDKVKGKLNAVFCPTLPINLGDFGETTKPIGCKS